MLQSSGFDSDRLAVYGREREREEARLQLQRR